MKVVLKLNNKLSVGIAPGSTSKGLWGAIQGEIENQKDLIEYVDGKIAEVDHTAFVTKEELEGKGYITSIPEEYITESELDAKEYLTEHQDLTHLATKEELSGYQVSGDYALRSELPDTSWFVSQDDLNNRGYVTSEAIPTNMSQLNNDAGYLTEINGYVSEEQFNTTIGDINTLLDEIIGE